MSIGKNITYYRKKARMNKSQLAKKTGLSSASIGMYENADRQPTAQSLNLLAQALNIPMESLLTEKPYAPLKNKAEVPTELNDLVSKIIWLLTSIQQDEQLYKIEPLKLMCALLDDTNKGTTSKEHASTLNMDTLLPKLMDVLSPEQLERLGLAISFELMARTEVACHSVSRRVK